MDRLDARLDALEGRLIAHRRLLAQLLALSPPGLRAALELALSDEMRLIHGALTTAQETSGQETKTY